MSLSFYSFCGSCVLIGRAGRLCVFLSLSLTHRPAPQFLSFIRGAWAVVRERKDETGGTTAGPTNYFLSLLQSVGPGGVFPSPVSFPFFFSFLKEKKREETEGEEVTSQ